ncbi:hypothetical protein GWI33_016943 [Rhynchophorus ferrugineus]|uniref:Uncharacterized protein n=1 Tax=Rhynchophorus ferrugineus TaxID=354439 RepID=A0A834I2U0_RHYFE|nr:hypothetical protein GWI33_016943 [Rhynchophorus ferrugineus]
MAFSRARTVYPATNSIPFPIRTDGEIVHDGGGRSSFGGRLDRVRTEERERERRFVFVNAAPTPGAPPREEESRLTGNIGVMEKDRYVIRAYCRVNREKIASTVAPSANRDQNQLETVPVAKLKFTLVREFNNPLCRSSYSFVFITISK